MPAEDGATFKLTDEGEKLTSDGESFSLTGVANEIVGSFFSLRFHITNRHSLGGRIVTTVFGVSRRRRKGQIVESAIIAQTSGQTTSK